MPQKYIYHLQNGKTMTMEGDTQPSDAEVEAEAAKAGVKLQLADSDQQQNQQSQAKPATAAQPKITPVNKPISEPTTYKEGWWKGLADYARDWLEPDWLKTGQMNPMLEQAAHPKTAGDFLGLLLPTTAEAIPAIKGLLSSRTGNIAKVAEKAISPIEETGAKFVNDRMPPPSPDLTPIGDETAYNQMFNDKRAKSPEDIAFEIAAKKQNMAQPMPERTSVTRVVDKGLPFSSDKPETWVVKGHLTDEQAALINDMYKSGNGDVLRGHIEGNIPFNATDEFGNEIAPVSSQDLKFSPLEKPKVRLNSDGTYTDLNTGEVLSSSGKPVESEFDIAKNKQVHNKLMDLMGNLTPEEIRWLDSTDEFGKPIKVEDRFGNTPEPSLPYGEIPKHLDRPKFDASKIVYPSSEARQPNMLSSVDNPDIPPPEFSATSSGSGNGEPPNKPPEQQKLIEDPENWKPEEKNLLQGFYDITKGLKSVDFPFLTSAAFRQGGKLAGTRAWFKAWIPAAKAFGSENLFNAMQESIKSHPLYQYAKASGLEFTDLANFREEQIRTDLAEKIPVVGRYIRASNRAYTTFLNQLRLGTFDTFTKLAQAERETQSLWNKGSFGLLGEAPKASQFTNITNDLVTGRQLADAVNTLTGRGRLSIEIGQKTYEAEKAAKLLNGILWSPRSVASNIRMLNPNTYMFANPLVRRQYMAGILRQTLGWWGMAELAKFGSSKVSVSTDPTNADFGKIKIGNTRIDPPGGSQQYLVLGARLKAGGVTSSTSGKFTRFGKGPFSSSPSEMAGDFIGNRVHPTLQLAGELANDLLSVQKKGTATKSELITDQTLQAVLPMYVADIAAVIHEDPSLAPWLAPAAGIASSIGMGANSYGSKDTRPGANFGKSQPMNRPVFTPLFSKATGFDFGKATGK